MHFESTYLDNGLQVVAEVNPQAFTQSIGYFVKTGARDETPEMAGVSHFLEHMVFKGTAHRSAQDVNRELDELGANSNAYTCEDQTVFYMSVLPDQQEHAVDLITDLMRPALRAEDFETERQVILEEIAMYDDSPPYGAMERCMESFFGDHPLATRVLGTPHTVSQLDPEAMRQYHQQRYAPDNLCLVATGCVDFSALVKQAQQLTRGWRPAAFQRQCQEPRLQPSVLQLRHPPAVQQYTFELAAGVSRHHPGRYAVRLMATIMGDDSGSRLFWSLVDPGLAESAGMFAQEYDECGLIGLYLTCAPEDASENWELLESVVRGATQPEITPEELEIARNKLVSAMILSAERPGNRLFTVGNAVTLRGEYETLEQSIANYRAVDLSSVQQALDQFRTQPAARVSIGPET